VRGCAAPEGIPGRTPSAVEILPPEDPHRRASAMVIGFVQTRRVNEPGRFAWLKLDVSL
jgi:hypothetical protein